MSDYMIAVDENGQQADTKSEFLWDAENYDQVLGSLLRFYESDTVKRCGEKRKRDVSMAILYVVATPIGNLQDFPPRASYDLDWSGFEDRASFSLESAISSILLRTSFSVLSQG